MNAEVIKRKRHPGNFIVTSDEGFFTCEEKDLAEVVKNKKNVEAYKIGAKVKEIIITPGKVSLLDGVKDSDTITIKYE